MSLTPFDPGPIGRAERQFREAFERLKSGKTKLLPKGSRVSQNNVAKEAGVDPSALRPARFPKLVVEIREWIETDASGADHLSTRQRILQERAKNRPLRERLKEAENKAGLATAKLILAEERIVELTMENLRLKAHLPLSSVTPLRLDDAKRTPQDS